MNIENIKGIDDEKINAPTGIRGIKKKEIKSWTGNFRSDGVGEGNVYVEIGFEPQWLQIYSIYVGRNATSESFIYNDNGTANVSCTYMQDNTRYVNSLGTGAGVEAVYIDRDALRTRTFTIDIEPSGITFKPKNEGSAPPPVVVHILALGE